MNQDQIDARATELMRELYALRLELDLLRALSDLHDKKVDEYYRHNQDMHGMDEVSEMANEVAIRLRNVTEPTLEEVNAEREQAALDFLAECKRDDLLVGVL
jgi:hypothetical protein